MSSSVVLFSGGLDSTTVLALAQNTHEKTYALTIDYGQLHQTELLAAKRLAAHYALDAHNVLKLNLSSIAFSALTSEDISVPKGRTHSCLLYTSPSPRDATLSRMPSSA